VSDDGDAFEDLLAEGEAALENLEGALDDVDGLDELEDSALSDLLGDVDTLARIARETGELVETLDLAGLPESIDTDELLEAIDASEIPEALTESDTGAGDVVELTQVFQAIDLLNAWDAADLTEIWEEKRELDDATDELDEDDEEGPIEDAAETVVDEGTDLIDGNDDGDGDDGLLGTEIDLKEAAMAAFDKPDVEDDPEAYQVFIQQQAMEGIDAFREALLTTNETFEELYETNREKMRRQDTSPSSRNPTAASTIATDIREIGNSGTRYSTVPKQVKLSTAPTRNRIYGRRFEIERKKRERENDND
jgi:hypothetical protein